MVDAYYSDYRVTLVTVSMAGYGWHAETGLHCLRLMLTGVFDRFPKLNIIVGHMGDHLPYNIARADRVFGGTAGDSNERPFKRSIIEYFRKNFFITTSGYFDILRLTALSEYLARTIFYFQWITRIPPMLWAMNLSRAACWSRRHRKE